ncbi:uncharacterized protein K02A2.6 [Trichonephila clavipes]|nr:uncharacterized protein K02A2.6 [Trichonephila clavipes]
MYGLNGAPAIWQRYVDGLFQGMDGVKVFMDDARITGSDEISHFTALEEFFKKCREHGLKLNLNKTSDASPVGIGCVLSHVYPDGSERPIAFASRTLSGSEKKYSQIDKEALSIVWAMSQIEALPVTSKELRQETSKDIELGPLLRALREGKDLQGREAQYTIEDGCIMYGQRVCIPRKFRKNVLEELHAGHLGIVKNEGYS